MKYLSRFNPFFIAFIAVSACSSELPVESGQDGDRAIVTPAAAVSDLSPSLGEAFAPPIRPSLDLTQTRPDLPPPPSATARTVEDFDTTSAEDRAAAVVSAPVSGERNLGTTIASLGSPTEPGIWFKTPLVTAISQGRVEFNGKSVAVELRPSGGAPGSASQISLAAMRLIDAPLTGLHEITVFLN